MLELIPARASVIACFASRTVLAHLSGPDAHTVFRVAGDEALLISARAARAAALTTARHLTALDAGALVVDQTDGWAAWTLLGDSIDEAFARVSANPIHARPALLQGFVGHVPAKVIATDAALHILVPATVSHHLRERVLAACADLGVQQVAEQELAIDMNTAARMQPAGKVL